MYSITPLLTGVRNPDQGIMTYQQGYGTRIWLPIWAHLLRGEGRVALVDTGLSEDEVMDQPDFERETGMRAKPLTDCLAEHGLTPADVDTVVNTHLHDDHCGNNLLFENAAFHVQRAELDFCRNPHPLDHRYDEGFIEGIDFRLLDGDADILPGLRGLLTPGHSPGGMSVWIETRLGPAVVTGFCCNERNFPANGPAICPGVHTDALAAYDSIQRIKALARDTGALILPMHALGLEPVM